MSDIGLRIKEAAARIGGLNKLSSAIGMPRRTLGDKLSGRTELEVSLIVSIAKATNVRIDWLVTGEGEKEGRQDIDQATSQVVLAEWLMDELGKIVVRAHDQAGVVLPPHRIATVSAQLYNELVATIRRIDDQRVVRANLPLLEEDLRESLRRAAIEPGTGKREAS